MKLEGGIREEKRDLRANRGKWGYIGSKYILCIYENMMKHITLYN
jgi:hypothetical protein